jgi:palmitoyltransferase
MQQCEVQCPSCLGWFTDLTALVQHAEAPGRRCYARLSDNYRQFIDQLTAGVIDLDFEHPHEDGTVKYLVPKEAHRTFNPDDPTKRMSEQARRTAEEQLKRDVEERKTFWDKHQPQW